MRPASRRSRWSLRPAGRSVAVLIDARSTRAPATREAVRIRVGLAASAAPRRHDLGRVGVDLTSATRPITRAQAQPRRDPQRLDAVPPGELLALLPTPGLVADEHGN